MIAPYAYNALLITVYHCLVLLITIIYYKIQYRLTIHTRDVFSKHPISNSYWYRYTKKRIDYFNPLKAFPLCATKHSKLVHLFRQIAHIFH